WVMVGKVSRRSSRLGSYTSISKWSYLGVSPVLENRDGLENRVHVILGDEIHGPLPSEQAAARKEPDAGLIRRIQPGKLVRCKREVQDAAEMRRLRVGLGLPPSVHGLRRSAEQFGDFALLHPCLGCDDV